MNTEKLRAGGIDVDGALRRFCNDSEMYFKYMTRFKEDSTMQKLRTSAESKSVEQVFTDAHTLKGLAGNLGLTGLYEAASETVKLVRDKAADDVIFGSVSVVEEQYVKTVTLISESEGS